MRGHGVILYGPPASGKDSVTVALTALMHECVLFRRLKVGPGRTAGYRMRSGPELATIRAAGGLVYENERYGATYAVDRAALDVLFAAGRTPVVHLGQVAGVSGVGGYPAVWTSVLLWCDRETTRRRCHDRGDQDVGARLAAWDETAADLAAARERFSMVVNTDRRTPVEAARLVARALTGALA